MAGRLGGPKDYTSGLEMQTAFGVTRYRVMAALLGFRYQAGTFGSLPPEPPYEHENPDFEALLRR